VSFPKKRNRLKGGEIAQDAILSELGINDNRREFSETYAYTGDDAAK